MAVFFKKVEFQTSPESPETHSRKRESIDYVSDLPSKNCNLSPKSVKLHLS